MSPDPGNVHSSAISGTDPDATRSRPAAPSPGRGGNRFNIGDALHDGMTAFSRAPLVFGLFAALLTGLQVLLLPLQERILLEPGGPPRPVDMLLFLLGVSLSLAVSLWGSQGMVRGAWTALGGQRPSLISLLRWDGKGFSRLLSAWAVLGLLLLIPLLVLLAALVITLLLLAEPAGGGHQQQGLQLVATVLLGFVGLAAVGAFGLLLTYLGVNQQFLAQIALLEGRTGLGTLQRGRRLVDRQWLLLLLLLLIKGLLLVLGGLLAFLTVGIGWILAWPLVSCITTAAYGQLLELKADGAPERLNPSGARQSWW